MTKPYMTIYHVFSDNRDEWYDDLNKAEKLYKEWLEEYGCARLYIDTYATKDDYEDGDPEENYFKGEGNYPQ